MNGTWTISPLEVAPLMLALESDDDVLAALAKRFSGDVAAGLQPFLKENEIPYGAWTRTGD